MTTLKTIDAFRSTIVLIFCIFSVSCIFRGAAAGAEQLLLQTPATDIRSFHGDPSERNILIAGSEKSGCPEDLLDRFTPDPSANPNTTNSHLSPNVAFKVECFGPLGGADDTGIIIKAANWVSKLTGGHGGTLLFTDPRGYTIASGVILPDGQQWIGSGSTFFTCKAAKGACITIGGDNAALEGISVFHSGPSGSSVGIQIGIGPNGTMPLVRDVLVRGTQGDKWHTGISVVSSVAWRLDQVYVSDFTTYGLRVQNISNPDTGDGFITGVTVDGGDKSPSACIRYESGGGLKMTGVKTLNCNIGFDQEWTESGGSQDLMISTSSFENAATTCMRLGTSNGVTTFGNYAVSGNEFAGCPTGLLVASGAANGVIASCNFSSISGAAIRLDEGVINFKIGINSYSAGINIDDQGTTNSGNINYDQTNHLNIRSPSNFESYVLLKTTPYRSVMINVFVEGILQEYGGISSYCSFILQDTGTSISIRSLQAFEPSFPLDFNIQLVSRSNAEIQFKLRPSKGTSFQGTATTKVTGKLASFATLSN